MMLRQFFPNDTSAIINIISKIYSFHTYVPKYDKSKLNEIARTIINNGLFDPVHHRINFPLSDISSVSDQDTINAAIRIITYIATVPALRRLMFINQLSLSFIKFPLVTHTRYAHSLGVAYLMYKFTKRAHEILLRNKDMYKDVDFNFSYIVLGIIAGLIHDIGHPAWGHALEPLGFKALPQHRFMKRYDKALLVYSLNKNEFLYNIFEEIKNRGKDDYNKVFGGLKRKDSKGNPDVIESLKAIFDPKYERRSGKKKYPQEYIISSLLDSPCDLDRLDYVYRDLLLAGIEEARVVRIVDILENNLGFIINNDTVRGVCYNNKAKMELKQLLIMRDRLYNQVYEHKLRVAAGEMLQHALVGLIKKHNLRRDILRKLLFLTDRDIISLIDVFGPDYSRYLVRSILINDLFKELCFKSNIPYPKDNQTKTNLYELIRDKLNYLDSKIDIELSIHMEIRDLLKHNFEEERNRVYLKKLNISNLDFDQFTNVGTDELPLVFVYLTTDTNINNYKKVLCTKQEDTSDECTEPKCKNERKITIKVYIPNWVIIKEDEKQRELIEPIKNKIKENFMLDKISECPSDR